MEGIDGDGDNVSDDDNDDDDDDEEEQEDEEEEEEEEGEEEEEEENIGSFQPLTPSDLIIRGEQMDDIYTGEKGDPTPTPLIPIPTYRLVRRSHILSMKEKCRFFITLLGASSKMRFFREENQEHLRFLANSEIGLYVNYCAIPFLQQLLLGSDQSKMMRVIFFLFFWKERNAGITKSSSFSRHVHLVGVLD